jgi:hypothetical protein
LLDANLTAMVVPVTRRYQCHGIIGDRVFLSSIVGNEAFLDNALNLGTHRSDCEFSLVPSFEKQPSFNPPCSQVVGS